MRFLGRKLPAHGGVHGRFQGDVVSDVAPRADHLRIKHRLNKNWIKMYDKAESVLRIETTLNDVRGMQVFRRLENQKGGKRTWQPLRKSVADLKRRADISQKANQRYLDALADVHATPSLGELTKPSASPPSSMARVIYQSRGMRGPKCLICFRKSSEIRIQTRSVESRPHGSRRNVRRYNGLLPIGRIFDPGDEKRLIPRPL